MAIILRSSKSVPLTFTEMDGNFSELNARTTTLENNHIKSVNGTTTSSAADNAITLDTDDIGEGSTNQYFTNARARSAISITDSGGDGSLSYNSTTGVITYTGPSAAEVRAHISATSATGVTYTAGTGVIALASIPNSSLTNNSITLEADSGSDAVVLGGTIRITGGSGLDTAEASGVVTVGITTDGVNDTHIDFGTGANQVNTDDLPEGSTNLWYTNARADARIAAASLDDVSDVNYNGGPTTNHVLTWTGSEWQPAEAPGAAGGEANTMTNVGGYNEIYKQKVGVGFQLRTINHGDNLTITQGTDTLTINTVAAPEFGNIKIGGNSIENIATNSNIALVPNGTGVVTTDSDLLPASDSTYDLGAIGTEWANAYVDTVTATTVTATNIGGTITTAAQGNITSLGTQTADLNMGSNKITSVSDPTSAQDAATKAYVDNATSSTTTVTGDSGSDSFVIGDTLTFNGTANEVNTAVTVGGSGPVVTIGLPNNVTIANNLVIGGDFTVTGTTTTVNQANLSIADSFIYLNGGDAIGDSGTNFTGSGLDDATLKGYFEGSTTTTYYVRIDGTGTPDTFEWSKDNFATTEATDVAITGTQQALDNNITIEFAATTGHTLNDVWSGTATPVASDGGFWVNENNGTGKYGYTHVGIFWDQSERTWKAVGNYPLEPEGTINTGTLGFELGDFEVKNLKTGSLEISGTEIKAINSNEGLEFAASGTGIIDMQSNVQLSAQSDLRFADADSSNWVAFQAPSTVSSNITWTLPSADAGVSGYALVSDGAGTLSWAAAGATVTQDETTNTNFNLYFASTTSGALTAVKYDTGIHYNPSTGTLTSAAFAGDVTGNASTATALQTARTIGGVSFDGTANINLPGVNTAGNQDTTGTAAIATSITATANNTTNETVYITFVDGATGTQGIETDTNLTYNPSTNVLSTTASSAQYADLAEIYTPDVDYSPGTVVTIGGSEEITAANHNTQYLAGVISTAPAYLMNSTAEGEAVALVGRVPVRVVGAVNKGQAVFAADGGVARADATGPIVGIALESSSNTAEKLIECLLKV